MRILYFAADQRTADGVRLLSRQLGHEVVVVHDTRSAEAIVAGGTIEAVLADASAGEPDGGLRFVRWVATNHRTIPRVLSSGNPPEARAFAETPPFQTFLMKPFDRDELARAYEQLARALALNAGHLPGS